MKNTVLFALFVCAAFGISSFFPHTRPTTSHPTGQPVISNIQYLKNEKAGSGEMVAGVSLVVDDTSIVIEAITVSPNVPSPNVGICLKFGRNDDGQKKPADLTFYVNEPQTVFSNLRTSLSWTITYRGKVDKEYTFDIERNGR